MPGVDPPSRAPAGEARLLVALQRRTATPATVPAARLLSHAGEHAGAWLAVAALGAVLDRPRRAQWVRAGSAVLVAHAASVVLKRVARRVRPTHPEVAVHVGTPSRWSLPSSHATSTTTAAVVLAPLLGRWTGVLPPVMAWSRMALGVHYPTDVLTGAVLGGAVGVLSERTRRGALHPRRGALHPRRGALHPRRGALHPRRGALHPRRGAL